LAGGAADGILREALWAEKEAAKAAPVAAKSPAKTPAADPSEDPNLIRVWDGYGREMYIPREHWRAKILPDRIKAAWDKPDELFGLIYASIDDGFVGEVVGAASGYIALIPIQRAARASGQSC